LRSEVYEALHSGEPFDMEFITCHRKKGTGGDLFSVEGWMKISGKTTETDLPYNSIRIGSGLTKDPHHIENGTINIFNPGNSGVHPISVHIDLIQFFNGKRVIN
jgi:hypothetical protein